MDNPGWKANRRAAHQDEEFQHPHRAPDGHYSGVEHAGPLNEPFLGGFKPRGIPQPTLQTLFTDEKNVHPIRTSTSPPASAVERSLSQQQNAPARMSPHLQVMCGPLLRYDTVTPQKVYRGACLIVTADAGSVYEPHPNMTLEWDPGAPLTSRRSDSISQNRPSGTIPPMGMELSSSLPPILPNIPSTFHANSQNGNSPASPLIQKEVVPGHEIWVYNDGRTTCTFWRFMFEIPLSEVEMAVRYRINQGPEIEFIVPAKTQNMRCAAYSCNGFSAGVNPDDFRGPGFQSGADPVWIDLLNKHSQQPFHVLVGGGDQLYCDSIMREPELQEWVKTKNTNTKRMYQMTEELLTAIDRFYFNHYCLAFRTGAFARANCSIPMVNMLDDHDLIDGFGSYPADLMQSPMFSTIGSRGYFFYLLFQCFIVTSIDGQRPGEPHTFQSTVLGADGPWIPYRSHSILTYLGPKVYMLLLDCRAERKKEQVCSPYEYEVVLAALFALPPGVEHLVFQSGIPLAYPRMNFLESALESKFNPLIALGRTGTLGLSSMVNKFNADAELLDDLNDHWTAKGHKKERNWLIETMQGVAKKKRLRITFLSGDVHCAAVGVLKTLTKGKDAEIPPNFDHRYMLNVVSSAIVNTPPPNGVLSMVGILSDKKHKTMHHADTDETMIPLFEKDTNGSNPKSKYIMGRRNWCKITWEPSTGDLIFSVQVEKEKGLGETIAYPVRAPPPQWQPN